MVSTSGFEPEDSWFESKSENDMEIRELISKALDRLGSECGEDDWDSYGAKGIKPETIKLAKKIFSSIWIVPLNSGGVMLSFNNEDIMLEIGDDKSLEITVINDKCDVTLYKKLEFGDY